MKKPLSKEWTAADRLRVVSALLPGMQSDIYAGQYSVPGRPNITSLQHILHDEPAELEHYREELESAVREYEKGLEATPDAN